MKKVTVEIRGEELVFNLEDEGFEMNMHREVYHEGDHLRPSPIREFTLKGFIVSTKVSQEAEE